MAYNNNIPQPTDQLSQSQSDILGNFQAIQTLIDVNHVDFASADQGKHKWVTFPVQAGSPPIVFGAGELALYSFLNTVTSQNELYINKTNQVTVTQIPTTASILSVTSNPGNNVSGWTYLPSGIILKWGNSSANGNTVISFPVAATIPVFTNVMAILLTPYAVSAADSNISVRLSSFTNTTFNVYGSARITTGAAVATFQYLAIGY
jgi:hypothetical protein